MKIGVMKAVILVGGEATRLLPLTCNIPKAMVPVLNTPFLEHVIRYLSKHQIKDITLAQSHLVQSIESYFGDGSHFGVKLSSIVSCSIVGFQRSSRLMAKFSASRRQFPGRRACESAVA